MKRWKVPAATLIFGLAAWGWAAIYVRPKPAHWNPVVEAWRPVRPEKVLVGVYHLDRWGAGRIGNTLLPPDRLKDLAAYEGKKIRIRYDEPIYGWNQRHIDDIAMVRIIQEVSLEEKATLEIRLENPVRPPLAYHPFELRVRVKNTGRELITLHELIYLTARGRALDEHFQSFAGGFYNWFAPYPPEQIHPVGVVQHAKLPKASLAPGERIELSVPFPNGLPAGAWEIGCSVIPGDETWVPGWGTSIALDPTPCD